MTYAYYPGCSLHSTARELDTSARAVAGFLGMDLREIKGWVCCGATPAHNSMANLSLALPVINLIKARDCGHSQVAVLCAACFNRLKIGNHVMATDQEKKAEVKAITGKEYSGEVQVKHFLEILVNDYGIPEIEKKIRIKLSGLKPVCYYGCLLVRPHKIMAFDDPENPAIMERLLEATGARIADWAARVECCGGSFSLSRHDIVLKLSGDILAKAKSAGANCIIAACPLCHSNLDMRQKEIESRYGVSLGLPVLYFTQVLGLAFGIPQKALGINKLFVSANRLLKDMAPEKAGVL